MRVIPASILAKLRQTVHSRDRDADPRINLVMQRTKRYIEQGSEMQPLDPVSYTHLDVYKRQAFKFLGPLVSGAGAAFGALTGPVGWVVAAIAALVAAFVLLWKHLSLIHI